MLNKIENCKRCDLYKQAGVSIPYIGKDAKYVIIGESPTNGKLLLDRNKSDFWELMTHIGLRKIDFGVIHSIQCWLKRPSEYHRDACRPWIKEFITQIDPEMVIVCGNFALHTITGMWGIRKYENKIEKKILFGKERKIMYWQHPNIVINNTPVIQKSIEIFKDSIK